jgi:pilus assembly protein Flp/PilA
MLRLRFKEFRACYLFIRDQRAVTAIEYVLLAALIAVVIVSAVTSLGSNISATFNNVASEL